MMIGRQVPEDPYDRDDEDEWLINSRPDGLEDIWQRVQVLLGNDGTVAGVFRGRYPTEWTATCTGPRGFELRGEGETPTLAMKNLFDALGGMRKVEELSLWLGGEYLNVSAGEFHAQLRLTQAVVPSEEPRLIRVWRD